jgi:ketosteroid isomerase-like protein
LHGTYDKPCKLLIPSSNAGSAAPGTDRNHLGRGDFSATEWAHPEIEWIIADGPTAGRWTGVAGMTRSFRGALEAWEELRVHAEEFREIDGEPVLVTTNRSGRGKTSGLEIGGLQTRQVTLCHVRDGKVTRMVTYYDRERTLADLGLAREGGYRKEG